MVKKPWFPRKNDSEKVDVSQIGKNKITAELLIKKGEGK